MLYLRPTAFVDTPVGFDGQVVRLAGGMSFFSAYEVIRRDGGTLRKSLVPVSAIDDIEGASPLVARITAPRSPLQLGSRTIRLDQPQVMGILNVTPDSFSDGGRLDGNVEAAAAAGFAMETAGAAIIDVGGESTRPGAKPVWEGDEIARTQAVIERLARGGATVSIDSRKASVMEVALAAGATLVNDVSALSFDKQALALAAAGAFPVIIMHWPDEGTHEAADGGNPLLDTYDWLEARIGALEASGIARSRITIDPGIGFGKGVFENLAILNGLSLFHGLGCPILLGASRKRFIGALSNEAPVEARLGGSLAVAMKAAEQGAQIIRVHDVPETVQALRIWRGLRDQGLCG
jgi:dihydropteroate synthase